MQIHVNVNDNATLFSDKMGLVNVDLNNVNLMMITLTMLILKLLLMLD